MKDNLVSSWNFKMLTLNYVSPMLVNHTGFIALTSKTFGTMFVIALQCQCRTETPYTMTVSSNSIASFTIFIYMKQSTSMIVRAPSHIRNMLTNPMVVGHKQRTSLLRCFRFSCLRIIIELVFFGVFAFPVYVLSYNRKLILVLVNHCSFIFVFYYL